MPAPEAAKAAREWMRYADEDLVLARGGLTLPRIFRPRQICFSAQQAAEKAIKALLVAEQMTFPFSHDLEQLVLLLPPTRVLTTDIADLAWLVQWATATRYPGDVEPSWDDARRAVDVADAVVADVRAGLPAS